MKKIIAGVDEVGRGSLIGPVYAAAVILNEKIDKKKLKDSKKLSKKNREILESYLKKLPPPIRTGTPQFSVFLVIICVFDKLLSKSIFWSSNYSRFKFEDHFLFIRFLRVGM